MIEGCCGGGGRIDLGMLCFVPQIWGSDNTDAIQIMTMHASKGLEFDSVIVYSDRKSKYLKREKNLLYVACTRAQHELIVYSVNKK